MKKSRPSAPTRQYSLMPRTNDVSPISFSLLLLAGLLVFYATSLWLAHSPPTPLTSALEITQKYPWLAGNHLKLSAIYYASGNLPLAHAELVVARDVMTNSSVSSPTVLGEVSQLTDLQIKIETSPHEYQKKHRFWKEVTIRHPNYRDAWIQLLYSSFNAGDLTQAHFYLEKVNELNPNNVQELPEVLRNL